MNDLISRQAAIDEAVAYIKEWNNTKSEYHKKEITRRFQNLPSVQPNLQPTCNQLATDVISRQAAIDILDAYQVMVENGEEKPYVWARLRMSELPSAHPELDEWCDSCKEYDKEKHCCPRFGRVIRTTLDEMKEAQPSRGLIEQIEWERDLAIQQLNDLGYAFGEDTSGDPKVIRCKDCKWWRSDHTC